MNQHRIRPAAGLLAALLLLTACGGGGASSSSSSVSSSASSSGSSSVPEKLDYSVGMDGEGFYEGFDAREYVTLPENYSAVPGSDTFDAVSDENLQLAIDDIMSGFATDEQITDRPVAEGDLVNIDYVGYIDGEAFEGGDTRGQGADYTAGSEELIDNFLDQIIGVTPGDTVDVEVTFPDPYKNNTDLSGKPAVFTTTVNYIHGETQVPELTDAFVQENLSAYYGYTSVDDMRTQLAGELLASQQYSYVMKWLYENSTFEPVPDKLMEDQMGLLRQEIQQTADSYGASVEDIAGMYGAADLDSLLESYRPSLEEMIRQNLMCQALAQEAGIQVDRQAVDDYFAQQGIDEPDSLLESYGQGYIFQGVRTELVAQYLIDHVQ